jgi:ammonia channel protein AmtB
VTDVRVFLSFFSLNIAVSITSRLTRASHTPSHRLPLLTDAGGVPVEIASGTAGLAYSYFIGKRRGYGTERILYKPHNVG